jgi:hypothetical protein
LNFRANVYTVHRKGQVISWDDYIASLQVQLEQYGNEAESEDEVESESDNEVEDSDDI